jgi:peroxiredoxin
MRCIVNHNRLVSFLAVVVAVAGSTGCGGSAPASPGPNSKAPDVTLSGTVKYDGAGLAGVRVVLSGDASRSTSTDSLGAYSFASVSGNRFVVTPTLLGYWFSPPQYELGPSSRGDLHFAAAKSRLQVGDVAPDFTAVDQNGQTVSLYSYRGKVVLIDFSADWCGSCRAEAPQLEDLYQRYKDNGFQALTVLVDGSAAAWASAYKITHPVVQDLGRTISGRYDAGFLPLNVILDKTMTIRFLSRQDWDYEYDEAEVLAVIKQHL